MNSGTGARSAKLSALLAVLAVAGYYGGKLLFVHVYAQSAISVRPYVMERDNIVVQGGAEKIIGHTTESRRHDGAIHTVGVRYPTDLNLPGPKGNLVFRRVDFTDGNTAFIVDEVRAKSTARRPINDQARRNVENFFSRTGPGCTEKGAVNETVEGTDTLFGYSAIRLSVVGGKDGLSRALYWRLPEFNCVVAEDYTQTRGSQSDEWKTTMGNRLTAFEADEPQPDLFTNWLSYDEMKPSDIQRRQAMARGITPDECPKCFAPDPSDVNYKKWHENEK